MIEVVSPYIVNYFQKVENRAVPLAFRAPLEGEELKWWEEEKEKILSASNPDEIVPGLDVVVLSESDSGLSTAERLSVNIGCVKNNGIAPQLRNKFQMNENAQELGLHTVQQVLASTWEEAKDFILHTLWAPQNAVEEDADESGDYNNNVANMCVLKPYRGVASDGVYCCRTIEEAEVAFHALLGKSKYEGGFNEAVLVQEYSDGQEYAVDTVALDGDIRVVALWRYRKFAVNGAPFVYQCSELVSSIGREESEVCDYCVNILKAQNLKWGPTHTEIKCSSKFGPTLIEINARWHAQNTHPLMVECLRMDAVTAALNAYFNPDAYQLLPLRPTKLWRRGMIVHLVSYVEGVIREVRHLDIISSLPSFMLIDMPLDVGDTVCKTVNIRTDSGYVLLCHDNDAQLQSDFEYIIKLQPTMFDIEPEPEEEEGASSRQQENQQIGDDYIKELSSELVDDANQLIEPSDMSVDFIGDNIDSDGVSLNRELIYEEKGVPTMKAAGKKVSKSAVEVAEVAKIPIVEVVEELVQPQKEEEPSEEVKNRLRVQFTKPIVKYIVSHHSGTILAEKDPIVPLDNELNEAATKVFSKFMSDGRNCFQRETLAEAMQQLGYDHELKKINEICGKLYDGPDEVDLKAFLSFAAKLQAPAYYYGQRLRKCISRGLIDQAMELLVRGCSVNTADGEGMTSLHYAANYNKPKAMDAIINFYGLKVKVAGRKGKEKEREKKQSPIIVDAKDKYGWTPLYCASHHGSMECAQLLLNDLGADVSVRNNVGKTALHAAMGQNRSNISDLLISVGASLNAKDSRGMTPLHECAYRGHFSLHDALIRHASVDPTIRDDMGNLSSDYCAEFPAANMNATTIGSTTLTEAKRTYK
eukprot:gene23350-31686_t